MERLSRVERFGVIAPSRLRRFYEQQQHQQLRQGNTMNTNAQSATTNNQTAAPVANPVHVHVDVADMPGGGPTIQDLLNKQATINLNVNVSQDSAPPRTWKAAVADTASRVGTIAGGVVVGAIAVSLGSALLGWAFGGEPTDDTLDE